MGEGNGMPKFVLPQRIYDQIVDTVANTPEGLETGVTLFGVSVEESASYVVLAIAGPGRKATHRPVHYSGDEDQANTVYEALRSALPGICWLGELHLHPTGMHWLSSGDRRTVTEILTGTDQTLHPSEFIAGVMQRREDSVDIYPVHFTRTSLDGETMDVHVVDTHAVIVKAARRKGIENDRLSFCTESKRSRASVVQTRGYCWLRQWWQRLRRHGRTGGDRDLHAR